MKKLIIRVAGCLLVLVTIMAMFGCNSKNNGVTITKEYRFKEVYSQPGFNDKEEIKIFQDTKTGKFYLIVTGSGILEFDN